MAKPTLQTAHQKLQVVREALIRKGLKQNELARKLNLSRQTISNCLRGKPIVQENFISICSELGLDWQKVAAIPQGTSQQLAKPLAQNHVGVSPLVQEVRSKVKASIQEWCGTMRVLDMTQPIELSKIYTNVNVLEKITPYRRKSREEFDLEVEDFDRFGLGTVIEERVSGLSAVEKYKKLTVLGKPGSGKTTFLKYLAIQCNQGEFKPNLVPIFITLKYFAEALDKPSLLSYIEQQFSETGVTLEQFQELFRQKSVLILLDGLDEVKDEHYERTLHEIRDLSRKYYDNHFVLTCRIAAKDYSYDVFDKFTEVEIADFDEEQIQHFVKQWFENREAKPIKPDNLLNHFKNNAPLREIAFTPLLLTLICLVFENSGRLPGNRSELYKEGIEILLKKWDAKRGIQRDVVYKQLSLQRKKDLLSQIAFITFKDKKLLFTQKEAERYIKNYIQNLADLDTDPEALQLDSEVILKSIEAQYGLLIERAKGIYSFSHLTFHEYFTTREIVVKKRPQQKAFQELVKNINASRWREVFLLAAEMSPDASPLLKIMKEEIDRMLSEKIKLQEFLRYVNQKASTYELSIHTAAVRAFYFDIDFEIDQKRRLSLLLDTSANYLVCGSFFARVFKETELDEGIEIAKEYDRDLAEEKSLKICEASSANKAMYIALKYALQHSLLNPKLRDALNNIYQKDSQIIEKDEFDEEKLNDLANESRKLAKETRYIGTDTWKFSSDEKQLLKQYYEANILLVECLKTDCFIDPKIRQEILDSLLLPVCDARQ